MLPFVESSCFSFVPGLLQFEMLNAELEEHQELANSRMAELEKLQHEMQQAVRTNEKLKVRKSLLWNLGKGSRMPSSGRLKIC